MKTLLMIGATCLLGFTMNHEARAIPVLTPDSDPLVASGNDQGNDEKFMEAYETTLLYKSNRPETWAIGEDEGPFASAFVTAFHVASLLECNAQIDLIGDDAGFTPVYALIKDGSASPSWYLYDVTAWNWTDDSLQFAGFWPNFDDDKISHVSIYGTADVPDGGTTAAMLGLSLLGMGFLFRRKAE